MKTPESLLEAAFHALRSYEYGNGSPDLAKQIADTIAFERGERPSKPGRITLDWNWVSEDLSYVARVPAKDDNGDGCFVIYAIMRPNYCDRGKWHVIVEPNGVFPLDDHEGFPRYYFRLENLMEEMEDWVNWRRACIEKNHQDTKQSKALNQ